MTVNELKRALALFPNSLEIKVECDGLERDVMSVVCCYPPQAKQYAILHAEDKPNYYDDTPYHVNGRRNDDPEPVITNERMQQAQDTITKFTFDGR